MQERPPCPAGSVAGRSFRVTEPTLAVAEVRHLAMNPDPWSICPRRLGCDRSSLPAYSRAEQPGAHRCTLIVSLPRRHPALSLPSRLPASRGDGVRRVSMGTILTLSPAHLPASGRVLTCGNPLSRCRRSPSTAQAPVVAHRDGRRLGRDPVPERGGDHRDLHRQGTRARWSGPACSGEVVVADNGSVDGSPEIARPRERASCTSRGGATAGLPGRLRRRPRPLHRDGRRRRHLRLRRGRRASSTARGRRRHGDGLAPHGTSSRARCRRSPLRRQPRADRHPQPLLPHRRQRRPLRDARVQRDALRSARPAYAGMEFASEMVIRAVEGGPRDRRDPDRVPPARGESKLRLFGRLAAPALPADPQPHAPLPDPGRRDGALGADAMIAS